MKFDRVVRLASTAALEVQVAPDAASAMRYWLDAPLVMIGADVSMGHDLQGKRARVIVVHAQQEAGSDADIRDPRDIRDGEMSRQRDMWRFAVEVGAEHAEVAQLSAANTALGAENALLRAKLDFNDDQLRAECEERRYEVHLRDRTRYFWTPRCTIMQNHDAITPKSHF